MFFYREPLKVKWANLCSASVLNNHTLMTAAHCLRDHQENFKILLGQADINSETTSFYRQELNIDKVVLHPLYDNKTAYFDIGLIYTKEEIKFTEAVNPLCISDLTKQGSDFLESKAVQLAGWGHQVQEEDERDHYRLALR